MGFEKISWHSQNEIPLKVNIKKIRLINRPAFSILFYKSTQRYKLNNNWYAYELYKWFCTVTCIKNGMGSVKSTVWQDYAHLLIILLFWSLMAFLPFI